MDKDNLELLSRVDRVEKRLRKNPTECLCPDCHSNAIRSHSQQRRGSLSHIAENGHVMGIGRHIAATLYGASAESSPYPSITKIGLQEASAFWGYCNKHDTELFKCLETEPLQKDNLAQVFALHLRAMSFERMAQLNHSEITRQLPGWENEVIIREKLFEADSSYRWNLLWRDDNLQKFKKDFSHEWVVIPEEIGVSTVTMIPPLSPIHEHRYMSAHCHDDGSYDVARAAFSLSVLPVQCMTHIVMCWHNADAEFVAPWRYDMCTYDRIKLSAFLNTSIFTKSEDFYIRPSLWNSLSETVKDLVSKNLTPNSAKSEVPRVIVLADRQQNGQV